MSVTDGDTGQRLLLDERMGIEGRGKGLLAEHTDETGYTVRRYDFMSKEEERRVLDELQAQGLKVDVLNRTVTPRLRTKPLRSGLKLGGTEAMRATARIALNFLGIQEPDAARAPALEPLKRWIVADPVIADLAITFLHPDGRRVPGRIWVGQPRKIDEFEARCPAGLDGLHEDLAKVAGNDTLQALLLAVRLLANLIGEFQRRGGRVLDPETGEPIDLGPYFGSWLRPSSAG